MPLSNKSLAVLWAELLLQNSAIDLPGETPKRLR